MTLAAVGERNLKDVTVTMVTWAKYATYQDDARYSANTSGWTHPVTLNVYDTTLDANGSPIHRLATVIQNVSVPWRPADDPSCVGGGWKAADGTCYNGYAFNANFDLSASHVTLPNEVIVTVAFDTQTYGTTPLGVEGPYNSLNVAVPEWQLAAVGEDSNTDGTWWDSTYTGRTAGLREDTGWTPYGTVALKITTTGGEVASQPTSKDQCKNDGWKSSSLLDKDGKSFRNQGQCVSSVISNRR